MRAFETVAVILTLFGVGASVGAPFVYEKSRQAGLASDVDRVITLTGLAEAGIWTEEAVHGGNYWNREFKPARIRMRTGEKVRLVLKSADVIHHFYSPALGIGPVKVYPGKVTDVTIHAEKAGTYEYYCVAVCGHCHYFMRGTIVVQDAKSPEEPDPPAAEASHCQRQIEVPPVSAGLTERGKALYQYMGCITCHGNEGKGGVPNFNYVKNTVPAHDTLAEKMFLEERFDAETLIDLLKEGVDLEHMETPPDIPKWPVVLAQYKSIRDVIKNGNPAGKADPEGPEPPLQMPIDWTDKLTDRDIDAIIAYLLTLQEWEEDDESWNEDQEEE